MRERKCRDLSTVKCVKDEYRRVLIRDEKNKKDGEIILIDRTMIILLKFRKPYYLV